MSTITQMHAAMVALIGATLTTAKRIPNGYDLAKASDLLLRNGYAITFGPAKNPREDITPILRMDRDFAVKLTRLVTATENDAAGQSDVALQLLEDMLLLIRAFEADSTLGLLVADVYFTGDNGIEQLTPDNASGSAYFVLTSVFNCRYIENLT